MPNNINDIKSSGVKNFINNFFYELFYVLTAAILVFVCWEIFWPGIILAYFNLNYLLIFWLVIGIIIVL